MLRKAIAGGAVLVASAGLAGCVAFEGDIKGKQISEKAVKVSFTLCDDFETGCSSGKTGTLRGDSATETRVLLAFRVPDGTEGPKKIKPKKIKGIVFKPDESFSAQMNAKAPRDKDQKWLGYRSNSPTNQDFPDSGKFAVKLLLPKDPGKTFKYRPTVGYQDGAAADKVKCGDPVTTNNTVDGPNGSTDFVCVDDPSETDLEKDLKIALD